MRRRHWAILMVAVALWPARTAAQQSGGDSVASRISKDAFKAHLSYLADDLLEGRAPGTRGGRVAALYLAAQFRRLGLEPAGDSGSYLQPFTYQLSRHARSTLRWGSDTAAYLKDQAVMAFGPDTIVRARGALVFAGYGISDSIPGRDDYAGADVRGKIVLVLGGVPAGIPTSAVSPDLGTRGWKTAEALRRGALAVLVIHRETLGWPWSDIVTYWGDENVMQTESGLSAPSGWVTEQTARRMLRTAGADPDRLFAASEPGAPATALHLVIEVSARQSVRTTRGTNVLARLPGRSAEAVVLGAHFDHLGIGPPVQGDSIYNGTVDNAAGSAGLLAVAEAFARSGIHPRRSILFVGFDAEEAGYVGSESFLASPPLPLTGIAAMLNLDGMNLYQRTEDAWAIGLEYSSLDAAFRRAAEEEGVQVGLDSALIGFIEAQAFFTRSDQYPFAKAGIPALFHWFGYRAINRPAGWVQRTLEDYLARRYHRPSDEIQPWFDYSAPVQDLRIVSRLLVALAEEPRAPRWNRNSPYQRREQNR